MFVCKHVGKYGRGNGHIFVILLATLYLLAREIRLDLGVKVSM